VFLACLQITFQFLLHSSLGRTRPSIDKSSDRWTSSANDLLHCDEEFVKGVVIFYTAGDDPVLEDMLRDCGWARATMCGRLVLHS